MLWLQFLAGSYLNCRGDLQQVLVTQPSFSWAQWSVGGTYSLHYSEWRASSLLFKTCWAQCRDTFLTLRSCLKSSYESFRIAAIDDAGLTLKQSTHDIQEGANDEPNMVRQEYEDLEILLAGREAETTSKAKAGACALVPGQGLQTPHSSNSTPICSFCSRDHYLLRCPDFIVLDVRLRFNHVCERKLRFHCLLAGHQARDCKFWPDLLWGFEGCQHKHYRLVHNHLETGLCSIEIWWVNLRMMRLEVQNQKSLLTILLAADSHGLRHSTGGWIHFNPDCDGGNLLWK